MIRRVPLSVTSYVYLLVLFPWTLAAPDTQGTNFVFGFMENDRLTTDNEVFLSTNLGTQVRVVVATPKFDMSWRKVVKITRDRVQNITIPKEIRGVKVEKSTKGIWIHASQEITVYAVNKEQRSTDAYIALPVDTLGTEYYAVTYIKDPELTVVGTKDGTEVSIRWPVNSGNIEVVFDGKTYRNGDTLTLTLDKLETFHAVQKDTTADFTGAHITASRPVAVLSGNRKVSVPTLAGTGDHLTEMLTPVVTWGMTFMTTSTPSRDIGDIFRIVASENNTKVDASKEGSYVIKFAGDFLELDIPTGDYQTITADKPVQIVMFAKTVPRGDSLKGDPSMCTIVPEPQYAAEYSWSSIQDHTGEHFTAQLALIIDKAQVSGLLLDGKNATWEEQKEIHGSVDKVHLWKHILPGQHRIYHRDPTVTFMLLVFGSNGGNSYALSAGQRLAKINGPCIKTDSVPGDITDNDCDGQVDEETADGTDEDGDGLIDEDLAAAPLADPEIPINGTSETNSTGVWSEWSSWTTCQGSCNEAGGVQTRYRNCTGPGGESAPEEEDVASLTDDEPSAAVDAGKTAGGADDDGDSATAGSGDDAAVITGEDPDNSDDDVDDGSQEDGDGSEQDEREDDELYDDILDEEPDSASCTGLVMESQNCTLPFCPAFIEAIPTTEDQTAMIVGGLVGGVVVIVLAIVFCIFFLIPYAKGKYWCDEEKKKLAPDEEKNDGSYRSMTS